MSGAAQGQVRCFIIRNLYTTIYCNMSGAATMARRSCSYTETVHAHTDIVVAKDQRSASQTTAAVHGLAGRIEPQLSAATLSSTQPMSGAATKGKGVRCSYHSKFNYSIFKGALRARQIPCHNIFSSKYLKIGRIFGPVDRVFLHITAVDD
jgi:hypothetical protein